MKKMMWIVSIVVMAALSGCGIRTELPDDPIIFESGATSEYAYIRSGDKIYVPYCPFDRKYLGKCIGYYESQESKDAAPIYIYEFKGCSSDEWIIELDAEGGREGMILREINTTNIPKDLQSEYEWNQ